MKHIVAVCALFALGITVAPEYISVAHADGPPNAPPLPQEGFDACVGKKEGEACTAAFRGMTIHGICAPIPDRGLFCRPDGPPPGR